MKIKLFISIFLLATTFTVKSQSFIGGQLGVSYLIGVKPMATIGVHFNTLIHDQPIQFGFNYHLPVKFTGTDYADAINGSSSTIEVPYTERISMVDLHILYRLYFSDATMDEGGFYAAGGFSLGIARDKVTPGNYDATQYKLSSFFDPVTYMQPYLTLGVGYDKLLDSGHILGGQFIINLNATSFNSRSGASGDPTLPSMIGLRATYSLPIGN